MTDWWLKWPKELNECANKNDINRIICFCESVVPQQIVCKWDYQYGLWQTSEDMRLLTSRKRCYWYRWCRGLLIWMIWSLPYVYATSPLLVKFTYKCWALSKKDSFHILLHWLSLGKLNRIHQIAIRFSTCLRNALSERFSFQKAKSI